MKSVCILTTFFEAESGYSLIAVVETQLKMLIEHGYNPSVVVRDDFRFGGEDSLWRQEIVDIMPILPAFNITPGIPESFEDDVQKLVVIFNQHLSKFDVIITHDIILQTFYQRHNVALRRYCKQRPDQLFLHWIHSCPNPMDAENEYPQNCRYTPIPGYIVYPNDSDRERVAETYHMPLNQVIANRASHSIDPLDVWAYSDLTKEIAKKSGLLKAEVAVVYPARLDKGKQPEKIIRLLAGVQEWGLDVSLLIVDWQSGGDSFQIYINRLVGLADELGIKDRLHFTSRLDDRALQGVPRQTVMELMDLSTVYVHPSMIETYSLVVHEAMLRGKLIVLNDDLPMMHELFGEHGIYFKFGADRLKRTYDPDEQTYWNEHSQALASAFLENSALRAQAYARRAWNPDVMWHNFKPLLELEICELLKQ